MHVSVRPRSSEGDFEPLTRPRETHLLSRKVFSSPLWVTFATHPPCGRLVRSGAQPSELFALLLFAVPSVFTMQKLLEFDALTERSHALTAHSALLHGTVPDVHPRKAPRGSSPLFIAVQHSLNEFIFPRDRLACPLRHAVQLLRSLPSGHEFAAGRLKRALGIPA